MILGVLSAATAFSQAQFGWGISADPHGRDPFYFNSAQHCRDTLSLLSNRYGTHLSPYSLNTASSFFAGLGRQHNLSSGQLFGYLDQYAASGGTLSPEVLNLSLERPSQAAASLVKATTETTELLNLRQNGQTDQKRFRNDLKDNLKRIRKLAKVIRTDDNLEIVGGAGNAQIKVPRPAQSLEGLRSRVDNLHRLALQIDRDLEALKTGRGTSSARVISREQLGRGSGGNDLSLGGFSVKAMAESAEKLAKDLSKTVDKI